MAFDFLFEAPEDNPTPELAAETAAVSLQQLDGFRRRQSDADPRIAKLDEFFRQSVEQHGAAFLTSLADYPRIDTRVLGLHDAVRPEGRLWDLRDVFAQATPRELEVLGVDYGLLAWHSSSFSASWNARPEARHNELYRVFASSIKQYGVPEWSFAPPVVGVDANGLADRALVVEALEWTVDRAKFRSEVAPLATIYGVGPLLKAEAERIVQLRDDPASELSFEVGARTWQTIAKAFGQSIGRQPSVRRSMARDWVTITQLEAEIGFDLRGSVRVRAMVADVSTESGLRLWQELDRAVLTGDATHGMIGEWRDDLAEMREVNGRPELTAADFGVLANSSYGIGSAIDLVSPQFLIEGRATREHYGYLCRVISNVADAVTALGSGALSGSHLESTALLGRTFVCVQPPLLSLSLAREGVFQAGRFTASLELRHHQLAPTELVQGEPNCD